MTEDPQAAENRDPEAGRRSRSAARLATVQALYQMELTGIGWREIATEFRDHRFGAQAASPEDAEDANPLANADSRHFRRTLEAVIKHQGQIDRAVNATLKEGWPLKRIDPTLRALFRAAGGELAGQPKTPPKVIINEYVEVAKAFFDDDAPRFANAVLDRLAKRLRADTATPG